ncbi:MAG: ThuA domain-containing protein, partial [Phycisphaerales bacterium]
MPTLRVPRFAMMAVACAIAAAANVVHADAAPAAGSADVLPRILVFSRTAGFRHDSIPEGIACLKEIGAARWQVEATEDAAAFTPDRLRGYRAVVFLSTTGDVLDRPQEEAFEAYVRAGGGFVGIHAATDTEYGWEWFGRLVGGRFATHPPVQPAVVRVEDRTHRSTRMLPAEWRRTDEWYAFRENPRAGGVHVLATLDETTFDPGKAAMGADHPICWCRPFEGGRSWYTAGGHTKESFAEPLFRQHLAEGIAWAAGLPEVAG